MPSPNTLLFAFFSIFISFFSSRLSPSSQAECGDQEQNERSIEERKHHCCTLRHIHPSLELAATMAEATPAPQAATLVVDPERFYARADKLVAHFAATPGSSNLYGGASAISLNNGPSNDDALYAKSVISQIYLLGYELPDVVIIFTVSVCACVYL
jgi:hypothetical protein